MTAEATNFRPPWAISLWSDITHIYCEIPAKSGPSLVMSFAKTEGGLTKCINLMGAQCAAARAEGKVFEMPVIHMPKATPVTETQRSLVRDILRKQGII